MALETLHAVGRNSPRAQETRVSQPDDIVLRHLVNDGFAYIPFETPDLIQAIIADWKNFLQLPYQELMRFSFGPSQDPDLGFLPRTDETGNPLVGGNPDYGTTYDQKDIFHYRPFIYSYLDDRCTDYAVWLPWFNKMGALWKYALDRQLHVAQALDHQTGSKFYQMMTDPLAMTEHTLRIIRYKKKMVPGNKLGKGHTDRCFMTTQIHESHSALYVTSKDKERTLYKPRHNEALVFTSRKAADVSDILHATYHDVQVPPDFKSTSKDVDERISIIFFSHCWPCPNRYRTYSDGLNPEVITRTGGQNATV